MSIYTRAGDTGETSLFGGKRVLKCEELVDVYGSIDELNSWIGFINSKFKIQNSKLLKAIQADLFTIGSTLAGWKGDIRSLEERVSEMEKRIDGFERELPPIRNFTIPGGSEIGSLIHIARSICRRAERQTVKLFQGRTFSKKGPTLSAANQKTIIKYLNRLSDLLFMLARFINKKNNIPEITWRGNNIR